MSSIEHWLRLYKSSNPIVRQRAINGLLPHLDQVPLPVLLELLDDPVVPEARGSVGSSLYGRRDETLAEEMRSRLDADDTEVRRISCRILGALGCTETIPELVRLLSDVDSNVRHAAAFALVELTGPNDFEGLATSVPDAEADLLRWARRCQEPEPIEEVSPENKALLQQVFHRLADKATCEGIPALSRSERAVFLPYWAAGIIGNGGFRYFFEGATEIWDLAVACEDLGLPESARACRLAGAQIPAEVLAGGYERCRTWMDALMDAHLLAMFERANNLFPVSEETFHARMIAFIREHGLEFTNPVE